MIKTTENFSQYRVVIAPDLYVLPDSVALALSEFVENGGVLVTDCRTGVKNETNLCHERTLPGLLSKATGISIEEYEGLAKDLEYAVAGAGSLAGKFTAIDYSDWISVTSKKAEVLAAYDQWHMKKFAAAVRNRFGNGTAYYVGTVIKEESFYNALMNDVLKKAGIKALLNPPEGVEMTVRQGNGKKLVFLVNHTEESKSVHVPKGKKELISGKTTTGTLTLETFGVAVLKL
jgi:beta-galactosidase